MKKKIKKVILSGITITMITLSLSGCTNANTQIKLTTGLASDELFKIGDQICTQTEAKVYATAQKKIIEDAYGTEIWPVSTQDTTVKEYVQDSLKDFLAQLKCIHQMADDNEVVLTSQEEKLAISCAEKYMNALTTKEKESLGVEQSIVQSIYEEYILYNKLEGELTKNKVEEISDNDARIMQADVIVLYKTKSKMDTTVLSTEQIAKKNSKAESILKKIKNGEKFTDLAKKYTEDENIRWSIARGMYGDDFDNIAFNLSDGTMSNIIETDNAFYLIFCVEDYDKEETSKHKEELEERKSQEIFDSLYGEYTNNLSSQFNKKLWKSLDLESIDSVTKADFFSIYSSVMEEK